MPEAATRLSHPVLQPDRRIHPTSNLLVPRTSDRRGILLGCARADAGVLAHRLAAVKTSDAALGCHKTVGALSHVMCFDYSYVSAQPRSHPPSAGADTSCALAVLLYWRSFASARCIDTLRYT